MATKKKKPFRVTGLYVILELWDGKVTKKHVYLTKATFQHGLKYHTQSSLWFPQQTLEWYEGSVKGFEKKGRVSLV